MATSGRGTGIVGYNVQIAVEANHHLIVAHEVTNDGTDRSQLSHVANETKAVLGVDKLDAVADRGYFDSEEILACEEAGITVTLPKPMASSSKAEGRYGKQDFRFVAAEDVYVCPAGEKLAYRASASRRSAPATIAARASAPRAIVAPYGAPGDKAWAAAPAPTRACRPGLHGKTANRRCVKSLGLSLMAIV